MMFQHLCYFFLNGLGSGGCCEIENMYRIGRQSTKRVSLEWVKSSQLGRQKADGFPSLYDPYDDRSNDLALRRFSAHEMSVVRRI